MKRLWRRLFGPRPDESVARAGHPAARANVRFDWCCICLHDLAPDEVWEAREHLEPTGEEVDGGGSWVARTYCAEHAPADAMPPVRSDR